MKKDNITFVISKFAELSDIKLSISSVYEELLTHPNYPSLLAISDVLQSIGIENSAFQVSSDELSVVPCPFIAYATIDYDKGFLIVHAIKDGNIIFTNEKWRKRKITLAAFNEMYDGVVLVPEPTTKAARSNFSNRIPDVKSAAVKLGVVLLSILLFAYGTAYFTDFGWQLVCLILIKSAGLLTSVLLLIQSIDSNNPLIQKLCQSKGKTDCNAILSSKAAQVFSGLTWSEVGFTYFAGTWLNLVFGNHSGGLWEVLLVLNVVSLPYTFYSIYFQARIAKQWCLLCCTVQALLWLEFLPLLTASGYSFSIPGYSVVLNLFCAFLFPFLIWKLLKPTLVKAQLVHPLKLQLQKFKYNPRVFRSLLANQPRFAQPGEEWSIVLGNTKAENIITMVTNPYCSPCANAHRQLHDLLEQNSNLQARIIFTASNEDSDIQTPVSRHLMTLHGLTDKDIVKNALSDWYEQKQKNYQAWTKTYPVELKETEYNKINEQKAWCEMAEITATPTFLLNGYRLPGLYQLPNLKYMLE